MENTNEENSKKDLNQNQNQNSEKNAKEEEESKKQESNQNSSQQSNEIYSHSKEINPKYIKLENEEQIKNNEKILYNQLYHLSTVMENIENYSKNYEVYIEYFNSNLNTFLYNNVFNSIYIECNPLLSQAIFKLACIYFKNVTENINYLQKNEFDSIINYLKCNRPFFNNYDTKSADKNSYQTDDLTIFKTLLELCPKLKNLEFCSTKCIFNFFYKYLSLYLNEIDFFNKFISFALQKENEYLSDFQSFF